ncbi:MAG TPA: LacI family DNA-binding transcriptional regulator [Opitutaceae bacterium]|jgi:LacI family transcriptional regulator|nr:LacI family DNA-binding transcriptional regulator [Opitutaceae bacterium]
MNPRRTTLADVARKAGVHVTTVSLALRNHPRLPETTRRRLQALAKKMGYVPDPLLRALVAYRGKMMPQRNPPTLAYVTNWNTRWGWKNVTAHPDFFTGAETKARELGFNLDHFWMREPGLTHGRLSRILYSRGISGLIIASHVREIDIELHFDWARFSAVKIDYFPHQPELHNVTNNQLQVIRLAMQRTIAAGYRRIGFVMDEGWDITVDRLWSAGFLWEQSRLRPADRIPPYLIPSKQPFAEWYERHRPEVVISKAEFVLPEFKQLGLRVPRDVAFVDLFLEGPAGATAGVRQNHATVGALAVEILAGQLQHNKFGIPEIPTTTYVEGTWLDGASCPRASAAIEIPA